MDIPAPYDYNTETFDRDDALKHVLEYPAFKNALSNHQEELYAYLGISTLITDAMKDSFQARQRYQNQKNAFKFCYKAALRTAGYSAFIGLGLFTLSFLGPLVGLQILIWSLLGIGACLFIALPLGYTLSMGSKAYENAEMRLKEVHDIELWMTELYAVTHLADIQDGMLAGIKWMNNDYIIKTKAWH